MHSPGVCGVLLAVRSGGPAPEGISAIAGRLIDTLNGPTELVLVAAPASRALAPLVWTRAAYLIELSEEATYADALRLALQEVLNRGRDTALLCTLASTLTPPVAQQLIAEYSAAGDDIWAVEPQFNLPTEHTVLLGRRMIEHLLRNRNWNTAEQVLSVMHEHVLTLNGVVPNA